MSGFGPGDILGRPLSQLISGVSEEEVGARIRQVRIVGESRFQAQHLGSEGRSFPVEIQVLWLPELEQSFALLRRLEAPGDAERRFQRLVKGRGTVSPSRMSMSA